MNKKVRIALRAVIAIVCVLVIIYFQRKTGKAELGYMLLGLAGLLGVLYDYNRDYTHPKRD